LLENGVRLTACGLGGGALTRAESWKLVHFSRHLPQLTDEGKAEMKKHHPKSPRSCGKSRKKKIP